MTATDSSALSRASALTRLGDHGMTVVPKSDDIRGLHVIDCDGKRIGRVADLLVDIQAHKVRFIEVDHGGFLGFGAVPSFIPVDDVAARSDDEVKLNSTGVHVANSPGYDPKIGPDEDFYGDLYSHYGHVPYWTPGYVYPLHPSSWNAIEHYNRD